MDNSYNHNPSIPQREREYTLLLHQNYDNGKQSIFKYVHVLEIKKQYTIENICP